MSDDDTPTPIEVPLQRPNIGSVFMAFAIMLSRRSSCRRPVAGDHGVGCVIASYDHMDIYSFAWNGNAPKLDNCCDSDQPGACGCVHAEEAAAIKCKAPKDAEKIVYCTHLPCKMCAKRLILLGGVKQVYYLYDYRMKEAIWMLAKARIGIDQWAIPLINT
jgi:deoxycytidylate deaminase